MAYKKYEQAKQDLHTLISEIRRFYEFIREEKTEISFPEIKNFSTVKIEFIDSMQELAEDEHSKKECSNFMTLLDKLNASLSSPKAFLDYSDGIFDRLTPVFKFISGTEQKQDGTKVNIPPEIKVTGTPTDLRTEAPTFRGDKGLFRYSMGEPTPTSSGERTLKVGQDYISFKAVRDLLKKPKSIEISQMSITESAEIQEQKYEVEALTETNNPTNNESDKALISSDYIMSNYSGLGTVTLDIISRKENGSLEWKAQLYVTPRVKGNAPTIDGNSFLFADSAYTKDKRYSDVKLVDERDIWRGMVFVESFGENVSAVIKLLGDYLKMPFNEAFQKTSKKNIKIGTFAIREIAISFVNDLMSQSQGSKAYLCA